MWPSLVHHCIFNVIRSYEIFESYLKLEISVAGQNWTKRSLSFCTAKSLYDEKFLCGGVLKR